MGLKVAFLSPCSWPEVRRGAERMIRELSAGLLADGHQALLITSHRGGFQTSDEDGVRVLRSWRPPQGELVRRGVEDHILHAPFSLGRLAAADPDVADAFHSADAVAAAAWSRARGRPAVFSYMGLPLMQSLTARHGRARLTRMAVARCDATVALSRAVADAFRASLGVRAHVIHPPTDTDTFTPGGARAADPTIFCAAAVDVPAKRVALLVRALPHVRRARPGTTLVLSDPGDDAARQRAGGDVEGVRFAGVDERPALVEAYRSAWVSALPSRGEAFGLVLTESLACGTPVVGSREGGIPEIVDRPEIGQIFDGTDERAVARALLEALEVSEDPATAAACRARAEDFSRAASVRAYEDLYGELLERRG